jgi:hypothetical protein
VLTRPYRFGIFFGVLNTLGGLYYGWLAVVSGSVPGAIVLGLSALLSVAMGVGLLLKRRFGVWLMHLVFLMATIEAITDWFKPHAALAYYICANIAFFVAMFAVIRYFSKRHYEFVS